MRFKLGPVELEFEVDVTRAAELGGGVKVWVVSAEAKGKLGHDSRNRIRPQLQPVGPEDSYLKVASEQPTRPG